DGRTIWFRDLIGIIDRNGQRVLCGFLLDITEQKRSHEMLERTSGRLEEALHELEQMRAQMSQQERLRALGELAAGMVHDFNNVLTPIVGYAEMLLAKPDLPIGMRDQLQLMHTCAEDA